MSHSLCHVLFHLADAICFLFKRILPLLRLAPLDRRRSLPRCLLGCFYGDTDRRMKRRVENYRRRRGDELKGRCRRKKRRRRMALRRGRAARAVRFFTLLLLLVLLHRCDGCAAEAERALPYSGQNRKHPPAAFAHFYSSPPPSLAQAGSGPGRGWQFPRHPAAEGDSKSMAFFHTSRRFGDFYSGRSSGNGANGSVGSARRRARLPLLLLRMTGQRRTNADEDGADNNDTNGAAGPGGRNGIRASGQDNDKKNKQQRRRRRQRPQSEQQLNQNSKKKKNGDAVGEKEKDAPPASRKRRQTKKEQQRHDALSILGASSVAMAEDYTDVCPGYSENHSGMGGYHNDVYCYFDHHCEGQMTTTRLSASTQLTMVPVLHCMERALGLAHMIATAVTVTRESNAAFTDRYVPLDGYNPGNTWAKLC